MSPKWKTDSLCKLNGKKFHFYAFLLITFSKSKNCFDTFPAGRFNSSGDFKLLVPLRLEAECLSKANLPFWKRNSHQTLSLPSIFRIHSLARHLGGSPIPTKNVQCSKLKANVRLKKIGFKKILFRKVFGFSTFLGAKSFGPSSS